MATETSLSGSQVYGCAELRDMILKHLDIFDLWSNLSCCKSFKSHVEGIARSRVQNMIKSVMSPHEAETFTRVLKNTSSAIAGNLALVITGVVDVPISRIDVVTTGRDIIVWFDALWATGYRPVSAVDIVYSSNDLANVAPGHQNSSTKMTLKKAQAPDIKISFYNRQSFVPCILGAPFTCDMVFVTSDTIHCMYPRLLRQKFTLQLATHDAQRKLLESAGMQVGINMQDFGMACEEACLSVVRHVEPGMSSALGAKFQWDVKGGINLSGGIKWRLGEGCRNIYGHGSDHDETSTDMDSDLQYMDDQTDTEL